MSDPYSPGAPFRDARQKPTTSLLATSASRLSDQARATYTADRAFPYTLTRLQDTDYLATPFPPPCIFILTALPSASPLVTLYPIKVRRTLTENSVLHVGEKGGIQRWTILTDHDLLFPSIGLRAICQRARVESLASFDPPASSPTNKLDLKTGVRLIWRGGYCRMPSFLGLCFCLERRSHEGS